MSRVSTYEVVKGAWQDLSNEHGAAASGALVGLTFALPLLPRLVPVLIGVFLIAMLVSDLKGLRRPSASTFCTPFPWLILFFMMHVIGMFWTVDVDFGLFDLQVKAALLVLPLLAMFIPTNSLRSRDAALFFGTLANAIAVLFYMLAAASRIASGPELSASQEFLSSAFSFVIHPSYLAMYLCLSLTAWFLTPIHRWVPTTVGYIIVALLCIGIVLCGSKLGWILLCILLPLTLLLRWSDSSLRRTLLGLIALSGIALVVLVTASPNARERVEEAWNAAFTDHVETDAETSSAVRKVTWAAAQKLFMEQPWLGTGTGDIKNELLREYEEQGQQWAKEHRLNAHSQFLQTAACLGIVGVLALVMMLVVPLFSRWRKDALTMMFLLTCALNWSVESMLEVQAGVVWTALMIWLLSVHPVTLSWSNEQAADHYRLHHRG